MAYMFGGFSTKMLNDMWELDLSNVSHKGKGDIPGAVWNMLPQKGNIPRERRGHTIIKIPGKNSLVLYGGYTCEEDVTNPKEDNEIYILDVYSTTWSRLKLEGKYPEPRAFHYITFLTKEFIIIGGKEIESEDSDESSDSFLNYTYIVNLQEKKISQFSILSSPPCPHYEHVCTVINDQNNPQTLVFGEIESKYVRNEPVRLSFH